jgi:hypothetical protein
MKQIILLFLLTTAPIWAQEMKPENMPMIYGGSADVISSRQYFPVSIADMAAGKNFITHVQVTGNVILVKHEKDGDLHIRLSDGKRFIVAECIPKLPCTEPKVGQTITVYGISRFDKKHKWYEVHPVEYSEIVPPKEKK